MLGQNESGTISFYNCEKKFGRIRPDSGEGTIFFHVNNFTGTEVDREPKPGDRVDFTRGRDNGKGPRVKEFDFDPFISIKEICEKQLDKDVVPGSLYLVDGAGPWPNLSDGLRVERSSSDRLRYRIHRQDVPRFVERVKKWERIERAYPDNLSVYTSETSFFLSTSWRQPAPVGFKEDWFNLPFKVKPSNRFPDGIISSLSGLIEIGHFGRKAHIPNPDPSLEPEYSGHYKAPE